MKKFIKYLAFLGVLLAGIGTVKANSISSINMDIYIDSNGDAHITEKWNASLNQGTEGYRFYGNMGNSEIKDFKVKDETKSYEDIGSWNVNASFDSKAYKSGINDTGSKKELCFGISKYGNHIYTLTYTITGFVAETDDSQIVYWELIPSQLAELTDKVYIKIYADEKFSDSLDVWGYGNYGGYAYVYDGYIEVSNNSLSSSDYMTVLVKFDKGTFNTSNVIGNDFNHYYEMAEDGAEHYTEKEKSNFLDKFLSIVISLFYFGFIIIIIYFSKNNSSSLKSGSKTMDYGLTGKKVPKDVPMFRDIPCNKDIYRAYWVAKNYGLMKKQTDFLGTIILKWLKQDKIKIENKEVGKVLKKEDTTIVFSDSTCTLDTELESTLYEYMYLASKDGILESKEFEKWCNDNYKKILGWFDKVLDYENDKLIEEGKLVKAEKVTMKVFKSTVYQVDSSMMEEAKQMKGLKNFFDEFENMTDKEAIEVKFWEEYLMFAQILGVAEKVAKQFKKLYPEVISDYSYDSVIFIHNISYSGMHSASSAKSRAESYSSGGGGFSSGGGGGGSFGGGGGGGFR